MKTFVYAAAAALAMLAQPAVAADLEVTGAFVRASPKVAQAGAGFVTIKNPGTEADSLIGASAGISKTVELHTHIKDGEMMRMVHVQSIAIPAGGTAELKPGGDHIMFINLHKGLEAGTSFPVTLIFEKAGKKMIEFPVQAMGAMAPMAH